MLKRLTFLFVLLGICGCKMRDASQAKNAGGAADDLYGFVEESMMRNETDGTENFVGKVKDYPAIRVRTATGVDLFVAKLERIKSNKEAAGICESKLTPSWHLPDDLEYLALIINGQPQDLFPKETELHIINKDHADYPIWIFEDNEKRRENLLKTDKFFMIGQGFSEEYISLQETIKQMKIVLADKEKSPSEEIKKMLGVTIKELEQGIHVLCFAGTLAPVEP